MMMVFKHSSQQTNTYEIKILTSWPRFSVSLYVTVFVYILNIFSKKNTINNLCITYI